MSDFVEVDRSRITTNGGSQYMLVPKFMRREFETDFGDEVIFERNAEGETRIRVERKQDDKETRQTA